MIWKYPSETGELHNGKGVRPPENTFWFITNFYKGGTDVLKFID